MNERIRELAEQAESYANSKIHMTGWNYREEYNKKFAELIVRECVDLLWNSLSISADHDGTVDGIEYTGKEILTAVKEYFGVES